MAAGLLGELLIDRNDRAGRRLQAKVQGNCQRVQALAQPERLIQRGKRAIGVEALCPGPAEQGSVIRQQVRRRWSAAVGSVDEIQPDRIAQQGEL
jgi:hypothetical protein